MADLAGKRKISVDKSEQEINLRTLLKRTPSQGEKKVFADMAIQLINERTLDGNDIDGRDFTKYSEAYADKKGVSRESVDLFLDGGMLGAIKETGSTRDKVKIGITGGEEAAKSHGHNTGGGFLPKREFFGITRLEADKIAKDIGISAKAEEPRRRTLAELKALLATLVLERDG